ncbi:hypothetical protein [Gimesia panareensis]|uniref:Uncharacterized protein n=1 Tax=Gimesia panareensis TaxID=2527978 RepID=A0A518A6R4_9PLAN|nr:hypothetical protein [Gimesia panareensis]QDT26687.1 hypothetical protein Enr10x_19970 [Gimesia panareensis]QDU50411.1 hypothetical protein Pan110_27570 [Gimesia panareensis]
MSESQSREFAELQSTISRKLDRVGRAMRRHILLEAAARIGLAVLGLTAVSLLFDWWLELSLATRIGCLLVGLGIFSYLAWRYIYLPFQVTLSPIEVANLIDRSRKVNNQQAIAPQVASLLQLPGHLAEAEQSEEMIERAVQENYQRLSDYPFEKSINQKHTQACLLGLMVAVLIPICFLVVLPAAAQLWGARWLLGSNQPWPRDTQLIVVGLKEGQWVLPRGESATLQIQVEDAAEPTESVWLSLEDENGESETITMNRFQAGDFRYELPPVQLPIQALAWGGDGQTEPFMIVPIDRPRITDLKIHATHPRRSEPFVSHFSASEGNVRLLPQSQVTLELTTNVKVRQIDVDSEDGSLQWKSTDGKHFQTAWTHERPVNFKLILHSSEHEISSHPRPVSIGVQPDRSPRLSFRYSGLRQRITPQATIPFSIIARDDFGIRQVGMNSEVPLTGIATTEKKAGETSSSAPENLKHQQNYPVYGPEDPAVETVVEHEQRVSIAEMKLNPGAVITFQSFAEDNCFTGRQKTNSRELVFRIVKPEELFREILLRQQQLRSRLRKARDQAEQLRDKLKLAQNLDEAATWLRQHQLVRREVGQVSHALNSSVEEMKLNQLGGAETWQLIEQTVLKPLRNLHDRDMEQQRQSLESLRSQSPEPLTQLTEQQDQILKSMDQILNNMAQWDSFIDVVNQLNAVIKLEQLVKDKTEELKKKQTDSIFDN